MGEGARPEHKLQIARAFGARMPAKVKKADRYVSFLRHDRQRVCEGHHIKRNDLGTVCEIGTSLRTVCITDGGRVTGLNRFRRKAIKLLRSLFVKTKYDRISDASIWRRKTLRIVSRRSAICALRSRDNQAGGGYGVAPARERASIHMIKANIETR